MSEQTDASAADLSLYGSPDSAALIVRHVLEELHLPYRFEEVDRVGRSHKTPEFLKLNPQGLLPVLIDADLNSPVFETAAILLHLADKTGRLAPSVQSPLRGKFLSWLFFITNTLHSRILICLRPKRYAEDEGAQAAVKAGAAERVAEAFSHLDAALSSSGGPYFLGEELSVLDFYAAHLLRWYQLYPPARKLRQGQWPALVAMAGRLQQRDSVLRAAAREKIAPPVFLDPSIPDIDPALLTGGEV